MFAGGYAPEGWALCDGQLLSISGNAALFSFLGMTHGGDGRTNFALPDLRGRVALHPGQGPGLTRRRLGDRAGQEAADLRQGEEIVRDLGGRDVETQVLFFDSVWLDVLWGIDGTKEVAM
jgi:microcystin-dependent protein